MAFLLKKRKKSFWVIWICNQDVNTSEVLWGGQCLSGTQLCPSVLGEVDASSEEDGEGQRVSNTVQEDVRDLWGPGGLVLIYSSLFYNQKTFI